LKGKKRERLYRAEGKSARKRREIDLARKTGKELIVKKAHWRGKRKERGRPREGEGL